MPISAMTAPRTFELTADIEGRPTVGDKSGELQCLKKGSNCLTPIENCKNATATGSVEPHAVHHVDLAISMAQKSLLSDHREMPGAESDFAVRRIDECKSAAGAQDIIDHLRRIDEVFDHMAADNKVPMPGRKRCRRCDLIIHRWVVHSDPTLAPGHVIHRFHAQLRPDHVVGMELRQ